ncbi:hypothetical protein OH76DRAFT_1480318 [Lentinus brumalis]|uniref:Phospholipid/glycerol acyltransferase domain-containing protein n=1 Tax=Lentinus brumalis TaxID=2498619 RepID=A0A371DJJ1_9APHY|nr:hypothetical protein OH76DRAFT_1480318 [Polyporus brumalis]
MTFEGPPTPWAYWAIRLLFRFALRVFYGNIILENVENIPPRGVPCILCPNHSNSLVDSLLVCTQIPAERREFIRPVAKSTLWGKRNFGSWLVENTGAVPVKRRRDFKDGPIDNMETMGKILEILELGDMVLMYPEGVSRYHPSMSPLKTGVARIVSDVLSRNRDNADFEVTVATCSITYTHREHFRSDVLLTFHPPMVFTPKMNPELLSPVSEDAVHAVTERIRHSIRSGTLDAPSWKVLRAAKLAANVYAPLGARLSLGTHVRLVKRFVDVFEGGHARTVTGEVLLGLQRDLNEYQVHLSSRRLTDDSVRDPPQCTNNLICLILRLLWGTTLGLLSLPGLLLWLPAIILSRRSLRRHLCKGPVTDTWDEIAEIKVSSGVIAGIPLFLFASLAGSFYSPYSPIAVAAVMWMSLRWMEDAIASLRRATASGRLLLTPESELKDLRALREDIRDRVFAVALVELGLPEDPESLADGLIGLKRILPYFSVFRRRKRCWNEVLRLYDKVDYPPDDS